MKNAVQVREILYDDGTVEAEPMTDFRVKFRRQAALASEQHDRIARQKTNEREGHDRNPDKGRDEDGDAL